VCCSRVQIDNRPSGWRGGRRRFVRWSTRRPPGRFDGNRAHVLDRCPPNQSRTRVYRRIPKCALIGYKRDSSVVLFCPITRPRDDRRQLNPIGIDARERNPADGNTTDDVVYNTSGDRVELRGGGDGGRLRVRHRLFHRTGKSEEVFVFIICLKTARAYRAE